MLQEEYIIVIKMKFNYKHLFSNTSLTTHLELHHIATQI